MINLLSTEACPLDAEGALLARRREEFISFPSGVIFWGEFRVFLNERENFLLISLLLSL
jgi:hypothetical protein